MLPYNTATKHNITTAMVHKGLYQLRASDCPWQDADHRRGFRFPW